MQDKDFERLKAFYAKYAPEKTDADARATLEKYGTNDEIRRKMWNGLVKKYGPEPSSMPEISNVPPSGATHGSGSGAGKEFERLKAFYAKYAPEKTDADVRATLEKYGTNDETSRKMWNGLIKKYGPEPSSTPVPQLSSSTTPEVMPNKEAATRAYEPAEVERLTRFYAKYSPEKTEADVRATLDKFGTSNEMLTKMWNGLVKKYGPEPSIPLSGNGPETASQAPPSGRPTPVATEPLLGVCTPDDAARLRSFYNKYAPEKSDADVTATLAKYGTSRDLLNKMWSGLVKKYGPEPSRDTTPLPVVVHVSPNTGAPNASVDEAQSTTRRPPSRENRPVSRADSGPMSATAASADEKPPDASAKGRLTRFFLKYDPSRAGDSDIDAMLRKYAHAAGGHPAMFAELKARYGPEPTADEYLPRPEDGAAQDLKYSPLRAAIDRSRQDAESSINRSAHGGQQDPQGRPARFLPTVKPPASLIDETLVHKRRVEALRRSELDLRNRIVCSQLTVKLFGADYLVYERSSMDMQKRLRTAIEIDVALHLRVAPKYVRCVGVIPSGSSIAVNVDVDVPEDEELVIATSNPRLEPSQRTMLQQRRDREFETKESAMRLLLDELADSVLCGRFRLTNTRASYRDDLGGNPVAVYAQSIILDGVNVADLKREQQQQWSRFPGNSLVVTLNPAAATAASIPAGMGVYPGSVIANSIEASPPRPDEVVVLGRDYLEGRPASPSGVLHVHKHLSSSSLLSSTATIKNMQMRGGGGDASVRIPPALVTAGRTVETSHFGLLGEERLEDSVGRGGPYGDSSHIRNELSESAKNNSNNTLVAGAGVSSADNSSLQAVAPRGDASIGMAEHKVRERTSPTAAHRPPNFIDKLWFDASGEPSAGVGANPTGGGFGGALPTHPESFQRPHASPSSFDQRRPFAGEEAGRELSPQPVVGYGPAAVAASPPYPPSRYDFHTTSASENAARQLLSFTNGGDDERAKVPQERETAATRLPAFPPSNNVIEYAHVLAAEHHNPTTSTMTTALRGERNTDPNFNTNTAIHVTSTNNNALLENIVETIHRTESKQQQYDAGGISTNNYKTIGTEANGRKTTAAEDGRKAAGPTDNSSVVLPTSAPTQAPPTASLATVNNINEPLEGSRPTIHVSAHADDRGPHEKSGTGEGNKVNLAAASLPSATHMNITGSSSNGPAVAAAAASRTISSSDPNRSFTLAELRQMPPDQLARILLLDKNNNVTNANTTNNANTGIPQVSQTRSSDGERDVVVIPPAVDVGVSGAGLSPYYGVTGGGGGGNRNGGEAHHLDQAHNRRHTGPEAERVLSTSSLGVAAKYETETATHPSTRGSHAADFSNHRHHDHNPNTTNSSYPTSQIVLFGGSRGGSVSAAVQTSPPPAPSLQPPLTTSTTTTAQDHRQYTNNINHAEEMLRASAAAVRPTISTVHRHLRKDIEQHEAELERHAHLQKQNAEIIQTQAAQQAAILDMMTAMQRQQQELALLHQRQREEQAQELLRRQKAQEEQLAAQLQQQQQQLLMYQQQLQQYSQYQQQVLSAAAASTTTAVAANLSAQQGATGSEWPQQAYGPTDTPQLQRPARYAAADAEEDYGTAHPHAPPPQQNKHLTKQYHQQEPAVDRELQQQPKSRTAVHAEGQPHSSLSNEPPLASHDDNDHRHHHNSFAGTERRREDSNAKIVATEGRGGGGGGREGYAPFDRSAASDSAAINRPTAPQSHPHHNLQDPSHWQSALEADGGYQQANNATYRQQRPVYHAQQRQGYPRQDEAPSHLTGARRHNDPQHSSVSVYNGAVSNNSDHRMPREYEGERGNREFRHREDERRDYDEMRVVSRGNSLESGGMLAPKGYMMGGGDGSAGGSSRWGSGGAALVPPSLNTYRFA